MIVGERNPGSDTSAFKWLILFGLLWAQVAYANHQLTHDIDELGESCRICASYNHFENALSGAVCTAPIPADTSAFLTPLATLPVAERLNVYSARASPLAPDSTI